MATLQTPARAMSIERFADDVAELIDRVAGGGSVDVWGFSLGVVHRYEPGPAPSVQGAPPRALRLAHPA